MSNEELAVKAQQGDKQAQEQLWVHVYKLLYFMCNKAYHHYGTDFCCRKGVTLDDFTQESYFAFLKAVQAFKVDKEYNFTSYLKYHLRTALNALLGQRTSKKEPLNYCNSLDKPIKEDLYLSDVIEDESSFQKMLDVEEKTDNELLREALTRALETCTARQQSIISLRFYHNKTFKEVGEVVNCHPSYVRTEEYNALRKLRSGKGFKLLKPFMEDYITTQTHKSYINPDEALIKKEHCNHMKERLYL